MKPIFACCCLLLAACLPGQEAGTARGTVFHDLDGSGRREPGEPGLPGVAVSNGREIVRTDAQGAWSLPAEEEGLFFVIKPRGFAPPEDRRGLLRFHYLHRPSGSPRQRHAGVPPTGPLPASIDFPLQARPEPDRLEIAVLGDPQVRNKEELAYLDRDVLAWLAGGPAAFAVALGDLAFDDLALHEPLAAAFGAARLKLRPVPGNHDMNYDSPDDRHATESYLHVFGPTYYSFDHGPVHFVVLDDVLWEGPSPQHPKGRYRAGLGERQLAFLENDLALVPPERRVVLCMHIPIMEIEEKEALYRLLAPRPKALSFSAHTHEQRLYFLGKNAGWPGKEPHLHINCGTACGSWWSGAPDERGIPHSLMPCGAPNGWLVCVFEPEAWSLRFQAASRPPGYQMEIHAPDIVSAHTDEILEVAVNFFIGHKRNRLELRLGSGPWLPLAHAPRPDPGFAALKQAEAGPKPPPGRRLPKPCDSHHIWAAELPKPSTPGSYLLEVRATDLFGNTHTGYRILRVE